MDPWTSPTALAPASTVAAADNSTQTVTTILGFENSFSSRSSSENAGCDRLPDSVEYLARLEARLAGLRAGSGGHSRSCRQQQNSNKEAVIARLLLRSDSCQLSAALDEDLVLEEAVEASLLLRRIAPEQPLNRGEVVSLVAADQLDQLRQQHLAEEEAKSQEKEVTEDSHSLQQL
jgi:Coiled-coil domain containing 32